MMKAFFAAVMVAALSVAAAGARKDRAADSVVYDTPTEWRLFSIDWPVHAFAVQGTTLWCGTERFVASINTRSARKAEAQRMKELGPMSAENISAITVDRQGRVWFGGPNGAAMKSGAQVTVFTKENGLSADSVRAIAAAKDGSVWVGTGSGADQYADGKWKHFTVKEGLVSNSIQCLLADVKGAVWFGTDKGVSVYDGSSWTAHSMNSGMSGNDTRAMAFDKRKEQVWAAVGEKDVDCFDGQKWSVYLDIQQGIVAIMADSQSRIWFGSAAGLIKFNGDDWINDPKQLGVPAAPVYQLFCDEKGNMWFAMETGVVFRTNPYPF
jgi:ligand-binding sensor domain-containing protein